MVLIRNKFKGIHITHSKIASQLRTKGTAVNNWRIYPKLFSFVWQGKTLSGMLKICEKASVCRIGCRTRRSPHDFFLRSVYLLAHCAIEASCNRFFFTKLLQSNTKKSQIFSLHFQTSFPTFRQIGPDCNSLLTEKQYKYRKIQAHKPSFCITSTLITSTAISCF